MAQAEKINGKDCGQSHLRYPYRVVKLFEFYASERRGRNQVVGFDITVSA
jgi:hypothetical protein